MDVAIPIIVYSAALAAVLWVAICFIRKRRVLHTANQDQRTEVRSGVSGGPFHRTVHPIFISYRRSDSADIVGRIYDRLVQHFGPDNVFKDVDSIPLGVDFRKHLADSIGRCHIVLAIIGKKWFSTDDATHRRPLEDPDDFVRMEIESALERDVPVIPVLVQGAVMPSNKELPPQLHSLVYHNAISIRPDPDFHQDVTRLIKGMEVHLHRKA